MISLAGLLLAVTSALAQSAANPSGAATIKPIGPPLEDDIVSVFIPPTRPTQPYVATKQGVFRLEEETNRWRRIYRLTWGGPTILGIKGYAKSSKVLYLVHGDGGARTKDGGETWSHFIPPGYEKAGDSFVDIVINPTNRKEAILARAHSAWVTQDYGSTWSALRLPSAAEPLVALGYAGGDDPLLVVATTQAVYQTKEVGTSWRALMRNLNGPRLLDLSPTMPLAVIYDGSQFLRAFDLARPGHQINDEIRGFDDARTLTTDCGGRGAIWLASANEIRLHGLQVAGHAGTVIHHSAAPIRNLERHPRIPDVIFWTEGPQLYSLEQAFGALGTDLAAQLSSDQFNQGAEGLVASTNGEVDPPVRQEAERLLNELLALQPPLEEVVAAALSYADYRRHETEKWKANVRRRHLIPQLEIGLRSREGTVDRNERVVHVDRFGVAKLDDLREDDDIESLDDFRVELRWNLTNLLFDRDQVSISRESRGRADQRNDLISKISKLYYDRLDMLIEEKLEGDHLELRERIKLELRIRETTDLLNQLCGQNLFAKPQS